MLKKVKLKPGQQAPKGNTGILLSDGSIVIESDDDKLNNMTDEEIKEYELIQHYSKTVPETYWELIPFYAYKDIKLLKIIITSIKNELDIILENREKYESTNITK